jgi:hypothetical protein
MLLTHGYRLPEPLEVLLFRGGALLAFALVGALAFGGVSEHFADHPTKIQLWGSFPFLSVGLAVGAACLVGPFVFGAFVATATYLMVVGFEKAVSQPRPISLIRIWSPSDPLRPPIR